VNSKVSIAFFSRLSKTYRNPTQLNALPVWNPYRSIYLPVKRPTEEALAA
jgi:hypothetical protein